MVSTQGEYSVKLIHLMVVKWFKVLFVYFLCSRNAANNRYSKVDTYVLEVGIFDFYFHWVKIFTLIYVYLLISAVIRLKY